MNEAEEPLVPMPSPGRRDREPVNRPPKPQRERL